MKKHLFGIVLALGVLMHALTADAMTVHDSDGFTYTTYSQGLYLSVYYHPVHVAAGKNIVGEGILFYDPAFNAVKIIVFENSIIYGWSLEGHWAGDGSSFYGVNNGGRFYTTRLYLDAGAAAGGGEKENAGLNYK